MRNTKQREEVYRAVLDSCDHPSAEAVYSRVKKKLPNISLGTVYRNLCILVGQGMVRQISTSLGAFRYDKTLKNHSHFYCLDCDGLCDIDFDFSSADSDDVCRVLTQSSGHRIEQMDLMFSGICKSCQDKALS